MIIITGFNLINIEVAQTRIQIKITGIKYQSQYIWQYCVFKLGYFKQ